MLNYLSRLDAIFQYAYHNERASFYRDLYGDRIPQHFRIDSLAAWRTVPFVTKADLQTVPLLSRTFTDLSDADLLRTSSGTSGVPFMTLRNFPWTYKEVFDRMEPTGVLMYGDITYATENGYRLERPDIPFVSGDLHAPESAARLAAEFPINVLGCWLYGYEMIVPHLDRYGLRDRIELITTFGERVTPERYARLKELFPNAMVYTRYGATEIHESRFGYSIDEFDQELGTVFRTSENQFMELIDPETGAVIEEAGREGEIVTTMLWTEKNPSPLLRYRMGDLGIYTLYDDDPWKRRYVTRGRVNLDRIRIPGGVLQAAEFERVFAQCADLVDPDFELHYSMAPLSFTLWVIPKGSFDTEAFVAKLMETVRISPERTYADAVVRGLVPPFTCKRVEKLSRDGKKRVRFIED